ncbi:MAG: hypothetical protein HC822_19850 [Oscillochloris sp.]|nr:hypothetical protein [Oscillochloris sp.]
MSAALLLDNIAALLSDIGRWRIAVVVGSAAAALREAEGVVLTARERDALAQVAERCRGQLGEPGFAAAAAEGRALQFAQITALTLAELAADYPSAAP